MVISSLLKACKHDEQFPVERSLMLNILLMIFFSSTIVVDVDKCDGKQEMKWSSKVVINSLTSSCSPTLNTDDIWCTWVLIKSADSTVRWFDSVETFLNGGLIDEITFITAQIEQNFLLFDNWPEMKRRTIWIITIYLMTCIIFSVTTHTHVIYQFA